jgi:hypothetical protein
MQAAELSTHVVTLHGVDFGDFVAIVLLVKALQLREVVCDQLEHLAMLWCGTRHAPRRRV